MTATIARLSPPIAERIYGLQVEQLVHDEAFHKDVMTLSLADRMKHMALHDAKYVGYLVEAAAAGDSARKHAVLTDAFIITLATANCLKQDLGNALAGSSAGAIDVVGLGRVLSGQVDLRTNDAFGFVKAYARATGRLAKACESWDHMEDLPLVAMMRDSNLDLFKLVLAEAALRSLDLETLFRVRLRAIEARSIFHSTLASTPY